MRSKEGGPAEHSVVVGYNSQSHVPFLKGNVDVETKKVAENLHKRRINALRRRRNRRMIRNVFEGIVGILLLVYGFVSVFAVSLCSFWGAGEQ